VKLPCFLSANNSRKTQPSREDLEQLGLFALQSFAFVGAVVNDKKKTRN
jgi:hypothetical protein|tara:strand:- start:818 stop:964 length:147 start_codon:yes stop_codon:yes gene_type:complete